MFRKNTTAYSGFCLSGVPVIQQKVVFSSILASKLEKFTLYARCSRGIGFDNVELNSVFIERRESSQGWFGWRYNLFVINHVNNQLIHTHMRFLVLWFCQWVSRNPTSAMTVSDSRLRLVLVESFPMRHKIFLVATFRESYGNGFFLLMKIRLFRTHETFGVSSLIHRHYLIFPGRIFVRTQRDERFGFLNKPSEKLLPSYTFRGTNDQVLRFETRLNLSLER